RVQPVCGEAQLTTTAWGDETSYTLTDDGGLAAIVACRTTALAAESSALPHTTCVFVPPSVSVTSSGVDAATAVTCARIASGSDLMTCPPPSKAGGSGAPP